MGGYQNQFGDFPDNQTPTPVSPASPAPGSTADLEQRAQQNLMSDLHRRVAAIQQPQQDQISGVLDQNAQSLQQSNARLQGLQPPQPSGGMIKRALSNFFYGFGQSAMHDAGLATDNDKLQQEFQRNQSLQQDRIRLIMAQPQLDEMQTQTAYRQAATDQLNELRPLELQAKQAEIQGQQQTQQFNAQMQPMLLQGEQQAIQAGQRQVFDYGQSGSGPGKGQWLVDNQYNPIRQLTPTSEKASALELQKFQQQMAMTMAATHQQGIDIVEGRMDPSQVSPRSSQYGLLTAQADEYSRQQYGKPFDFAKAAGDYKYANNPQTKNTLNYLNSLTGPDGKSGNLQELVNRSNDIGRTPFPALNDVAAWARLEAGSPKIAAYHATVTEVSDQVAKILQGGGSGTSDAKMKQAQELFRTGFSADQISAVAGTLQSLLQNRKSSLIGNNTYLQRWYGQGGSGGPQALGPIPQPAGATMKVPGSDGHMHWSDGKQDLGRAD